MLATTAPAVFGVPSVSYRRRTDQHTRFQQSRATRDPAGKEAVDGRETLRRRCSQSHTPSSLSPGFFVSVLSLLLLFCPNHWICASTSRKYIWESSWVSVIIVYSYDGSYPGVSFVLSRLAVIPETGPEACCDLLAAGAGQRKGKKKILKSRF